MTFVAVLPSIYPLWTKRCLRTCAFADDVLVVDNTEHNRGVAASWNLGVDRLYEAESDWLVIISASIRFGEPGGKDFLAELDARPDDLAVEAAHGMGWHLIGFHRRVFDAVGRFDENFHPAYWEDNDFAQRIRLVWKLEPPFWSKVSVDVSSAGWAHGIDLGGVRAHPNRLKGYWTSKWGCEPPLAEFTAPFGSMPIDYWPPR